MISNNYQQNVNNLKNKFQTKKWKKIKIYPISNYSYPNISIKLNNNNYKMKINLFKNLTNNNNKYNLHLKNNTSLNSLSNIQINNEILIQILLDKNILTSEYYIFL